MIGFLGIIIIFGAIIFIHEFGHYMTAKLSGMGVHEFSMGFGPALLQWKRKGTLYAIRAIPLGGYVRIAGMALDDEEDNRPDGFDKKPFFARFATLFAGAFMNFVLALIVMIVVGMTIGIPQPTARATVQQVIPITAANAPTPAKLAGIQPDDVIVRVNDIENPTSESLSTVVRNSKGPVSLVIERHGQRMPPVAITPVVEEVPTLKGITLVRLPTRLIGIQFKFDYVPAASPMAAIIDGAQTVVGMVRMAIANVLFIFSGNAKITEIGGPVMVMKVAHDASVDALDSRANLANFFGIMATLSVLVGFFNLLPIPALDGGRLLVLVLEKISGRQFDHKKEAIVHLVGMAVLLAFIAVISVKDIIFWIQNK